MLAHYVAVSPSKGSLSPPTVSWTRCVSVLFEQIETSFLPYVTFLLVVTLLGLIKKTVLVPWTRPCTPWANRPRSLAYARSHSGLNGPFIRAPYSSSFPVLSLSTAHACGRLRKLYSCVGRESSLALYGIMLGCGVASTLGWVTTMIYWGLISFGLFCNTIDGVTTLGLGLTCAGLCSHTLGSCTGLYLILQVDGVVVLLCWGTFF